MPRPREERHVYDTISPFKNGIDLEIIALSMLALRERKGKKSKYPPTPISRLDTGFDVGLS